MHKHLEMELSRTDRREKKKRRNYKNLENGEMENGERFVYFIFDGLTLYILFLQFTPWIHFILFNRVCIYRNERLSERVYRLTRKIEKSCHSLHIWLHRHRQGSIDHPCLTLSLTTLLIHIYIYIWDYIHIRELFKNKKFTRKEFKYLPNSICVSKIYPFFFAF